MSRVIPDFDARLSAWLDDEKATGLLQGNGQDGKYLARPSDGYLATERAYEEVSGIEHTVCPKDDRSGPLIVQVFGKDQVSTLVTIPLEKNARCVIGALQEDPEVLGVRVIGYEPPAGDDDEEEPEEPELTVTSLDPEIVASWTGPSATPRPLLDGGYWTPARTTIAAALLAGAALFLYRRVTRRR